MIYIYVNVCLLICQFWTWSIESLEWKMWFSSHDAPPQSYLILALQLYKFHASDYFKNFKSDSCVFISHPTNFQCHNFVFVRWDCYFLFATLLSLTFKFHFLEWLFLSCTFALDCQDVKTWPFYHILHPPSLLSWFFWIDYKSWTPMN